jgi:hypothetical protein
VRGVAALETVDGVAEEDLAMSTKSRDQADAAEGRMPAFLAELTGS